MAKTNAHVEIDDSLFRKKLKKLAKEAKVTEKDFVKEQTGLLARDIARYTPPFDGFPTNKQTSIGTGADFKKGKEAVKGSLHSICQIRLKSQINKIKKRNNGSTGAVIINGIQWASGIIEDEGTLASFHARVSDPSTGRTRRISRNEKPYVYKTAFNKYLRTVMGRVGMSKAPFAKAAIQLGAKGSIPLPVRKNMAKANGSGMMSTRSTRSVGTVRGSAPGLPHTKRNLSLLRKNRIAKAEKRLKYLAGKVVRDTNKQTK